MKKLLITSVFVLSFTNVCLAETWVNNYGYWENKNEISAKSGIIGSINPTQIYDFNTSKNAGGEKIVDGKYYIPISYNGGYNGTDTDYIYVEELKGADGKDGLNGTQGLQGVAGEVGQAGVNGLNGVDGAKGETGATGAKGDTGKGLEDRVEGIVELRVLDTRKTTWTVYAGHDFNNDVNIVGAKVTLKIGRSYYEKKIDELESRLNRAENQTQVNTGEVYATNSGFGIRDKF